MARGGNARGGARGKGRRSWGGREGPLMGGISGGAAGFHSSGTSREDFSSIAEGLGAMSINPVLVPYSVGAGGQQGLLALPQGGGGGYFQGYIPMEMRREELGLLGGLRGGDMQRNLNPTANEYMPPHANANGKQVWKANGGEGEDRSRGGGGGRKRRPRRGKDKQEALAENVKRTVYISDLDQEITEEQLASFFQDVGVVSDCRVCGDPNSAMRFAFVEFAKPEDAVSALSKSGEELGSTKLKVLPSKTAIVPVNKDLMPKNKEEMEQCSRTVYATNIDKKVDRDDVQRFFEALCGPVSKLRLLGDHAHSTRIAFVEFQHADSALAALSCSGALLGTMPIRVSPSKTPVRNPKESELIK